MTLRSFCNRTTILDSKVEFKSVWNSTLNILYEALLPIGTPNIIMAKAHRYPLGLQYHTIYGSVFSARFINES